MNIAEIKELSNGELDYELHKLFSKEVELVDVRDGTRFLAPQKYIHQFKFAEPALGNEPIDFNSFNYDYCNDLNKIAIIERFIIKKVGASRLFKTLDGAVGDDDCWSLPFRTARERAEACLLVLTADTQEKDVEN